MAGAPINKTTSVPFFGDTLTKDAKRINLPQGYQPSTDTRDRIEVELLERPKTSSKKLRRKELKG